MNPPRLFAPLLVQDDEDDFDEEDDLDDDERRDREDEDDEDEDEDDEAGETWYVCQDGPSNGRVGRVRSLDFDCRSSYTGAVPRPHRRLGYRC